MSFSPVNESEVSRFIAPGRGVWVDGDEVEIDRVCCFKGKFVLGFACTVGGTILCAGVCLTGGCAEGLTCVCILVFTTSRGHVITPASPPAAAPVKSSSGNPISLLLFHCRAQVCPCS